MRITLILDEDVSDDVLRRGLRAMTEGERTRPVFVTKSVDLRPARLPLDNIAETLAAVEGEGYR